MLLSAAAAAAPGGDDLHIIAPTEDDIRRELGLDFEERLEELIRQEIEAPFGRFGATSAITNDSFTDVLEHLFSDPLNDAIFDDWYNNFGADIDAALGHLGPDMDQVDERPAGRRKERSPNLFPYDFGDVHTANWHIKFLADDVRERTRTLAKRDRHAEFRSHFRVTLEKLEYLRDLFLEKGWITKTKHCRDDATLKIKAELLILGCLNVLGHATPFRCLPVSTNISFTEHRLFFHRFIDHMYSIRDEHIYLPRNVQELKATMARYESVGLPGNTGSIDVVHSKWSLCPAGDLSRAKGKEGYPSIAWEVISDFDRRVLGVSSAQFGTRNDKHIVKIDKNVARIRDDWYAGVKWTYYTRAGEVKEETGVYLICDGGYCRWPITICPYNGVAKNTLEGYFSTNLEGVRKDVECLFGILKKRWSILDYGLRFRDIIVCEKVFVTCCILHNLMLDEMTRQANPPRAVRGAPPVGHGLWLRGPRPMAAYESSDGALANKWGKRRKLLAGHLEFAKKQRLL
ncbi:hypothetical protein ACHAXT_003464 [Thalassiosira profunda]